ncbi:hypothetical protein AVEN_61976-1 [Araneus ventricosus]|uniref:Uncharacterized protein n=1 Tax=Araneus ventricosus TaxID=182803 RepID=A0A4Y2VH19_ARAVE|nr:hypothetical protein AVEN_61976-1 [Araneus ventricosus]
MLIFRLQFVSPSTITKDIVENMHSKSEYLKTHTNQGNIVNKSSAPTFEQALWKTICSANMVRQEDLSDHFGTSVGPVAPLKALDVTWCSGLFIIPLLQRHL